MNNLTIFIFGFTGDLCRKKLLPALYQLYVHDHLSHFHIIGLSREDVNLATICEKIKPFIENIDETMWCNFIKKIIYKPFDVTEETDFYALSKFIQNNDNVYSCNENRLFYLAVSSHFFADITHFLSTSQLCQKNDHLTNRWHRIVYEKPFGNNLESARSINKQIQQSFDENQIYRIDHYLTKELVSNIALVRFANSIFQPLWDHKSVDQVHIILDEAATIEGRGSYYDHYGALRDVVQNHMLQLMALITMESPQKLTGEDIRTSRATVLNQIQFVDGMLGQYKGYRTEEHVAALSTTETFALLKFVINNDRWHNVSFFLRTGKALRNREVGVHIKFKAVDCLLTQGFCAPSNWLSFVIAPEAVFSLQLNVKKPGTQATLLPVDMAFCHSCVFGMRQSEAYELLIQEIVRGEQTSAVRYDEIELSWQLIDAIKRKHLPLYEYEKNSTGPQEMKIYADKWGIQWQKNT